MEELIIRMNSLSEETDIEILHNNLLTEEIIEKKLTLKSFYEVLSTQIDINTEVRKPKLLLKNSIIGYSKHKDNEVYLINQKEQNRMITTSFGKVSKAYKINFPNSLYVVSATSNKINYIEAYCYKEFKSLDTELYQYPMPNMLGGNRICIGFAPTELKRDVISALETIIYSPYSHSNVNNIKSFNSTVDYFKYLSENEFPYKFLNKLSKQLRDLGD